MKKYRRKKSEENENILNLTNFSLVFDSVKDLKKLIIEDAIQYKSVILRLHTEGVINEDILKEKLNEIDIIAFKTLLSLSKKLIQGKSLDEVVKSGDDNFAVYAKLHEILQEVIGEIGIKRQRFDYLHIVIDGLSSELKKVDQDDFLHIQKLISTHKEEIKLLEEEIDQNGLLTHFVETIRTEIADPKSLLNLQNPLPAALQDANKNLDDMAMTAIILNGVRGLNFSSTEKKESEQEIRQRETQENKVKAQQRKEEKGIEIYHKINETIEVKLNEIIGQLESQFSRNAKKFTLFSYSTVVQNAHIRMKIQILQDAQKPLFEHFDNDPNQYLEVLKTLLQNPSAKEFSASIIDEADVIKLENIVGTMGEIYKQASVPIMGR